jgi:hypothetical protein
MVILYLQDFLHSRIPQELKWTPCKGGPLEDSFDAMKKGLLCTFTMCFVKEKGEMYVNMLSAWV